MAERVPLTVLVVTKNPGPALDACLAALHDFDEVIVVDSHSIDDTAAITAKHNVRYIPYTWNGAYPKKRQWTLENIQTKHEWIFFVDADEIVTADLKNEITHNLNTNHAAFFVRGQPIFSGKALAHGRWNNKIVVMRKHAAHYPIYHDTHTAMGEIEGHYQPHINGSIGQLKNHVIHSCAESLAAWQTRHQRYASWQAEMELAGHTFSTSETGLRRIMKSLFMRSALRPMLAFIDSYFLKCGFMDRRAGYDYAAARAWYYALISAKKRAISSTISDNCVSGQNRSG